MKRFLIDVNLPYYFSLWNSDEYLHVKDIDDTWTDEQVWNFAKSNTMTIITKDSDFSYRILDSLPPPKVIHIKTGNMKLKELFQFLSVQWPVIIDLSSKNKLVNVFFDRIECIE